MQDERISDLRGTGFQPVNPNKDFVLIFMTASIWWLDTTHQSSPFVSMYR